MEDPVDVKHPYTRAERCVLNIARDMIVGRFHYLPRSQSCCGLHNGVTIGYFFGGVGGCLVVSLM